MTKIIVQPGTCGFPVTIKAKRGINKKVKISIETECEMVMNMLEEITSLDIKALFTNHLNNPIYISAAKHLKHVACPVTSGILKAIEVEVQLALPEDVSIKFIKEESLQTFSWL